MFNKYFVPALGVVAFIIGGIVAREQAMTTATVLKNKFGEQPEPPVEEVQS